MNYYAKEYETYFAKTVQLNPASFLLPFVKRLPKNGAKILDIGCGSGRDLRWLKERGFDAVGIERSAGLAMLARQFSGCEVIEADFETFDFSGASADGLLLIGALVHIPHDHLETILKKIIKGVKPQGIIYISMKKVDKRLKYIEYTASGRIFYFWRRFELEEIFQRNNLEIISFSENESLLETSEKWLGYILNKKSTTNNIY
ncbi:MAG: class I SAM-dependent methyltransferase [Desulfamplus sp.]|nr:class I SAM-dependent methyltransferase [Desulfamplus sp.]